MGGEKKNAPDLYSETFGKGNNSDQEHEHRLSRYALARRRVQAVLDYIEHIKEFSKEYEVLWWCGRKLIFRLFLISRAYRLIGGCSCKKRLLCCLCDLRHSARLSKEYELKFRQVLDEHPDWTAVLITRTVKNGFNLGERYGHFKKAHKKMMSYRHNSVYKTTSSGFATKSVMGLIHGGAGSYEFKRGENSDGWHPHTHEIALLDGLVEFTEVVRKGRKVMVPLEFERRLSEEWHKATGDSYIVDVRMLNRDDEQGFRKGVCEAFKYALKSSDMEVEDQVHAYKVLKGKRLVYSYGALWGVKISDSTIDTVEEALKLEPYVDIIYSFSGEKYIVEDVCDFGLLEKTKFDRSSRRPKEPFEIHFDDGSVINLETVEKFIAERKKEEQPEEVPF